MAQWIVSVSPSSMLMRMASALVSVWRVLAVHALRAHSWALAAASWLVSLVQCWVVEAMKANVSPGVLLPGRKNGHHECGTWDRGCWAVGDALFGCGDTGKIGQEGWETPGEDESWVLEALADGQRDGDAVA